MNADEITFEFACRDDCLDKMVPSDLRVLVKQRDNAREAHASLLAAVEDGDEIARELREVELTLDATDMPVHSAAVRAARARITLDAQEKAALKGENEKLREACAAGWGEPALINTLKAELAQARTTSQFHKDNHLAAEAELASVKAERDALKERIWQIRVELGALFTMLPNEVPGLAMEVCERDADRQCLFRAFELAAHKEGA